MKKLIVAILWIALLNGVLVVAFAELSVKFNPTITREQAYRFGETYGFAFLVVSILLIVYLAATNRLPGARQRTSSKKA